MGSLTEDLNDDRFFQNASFNFEFDDSIPTSTIKSTEEFQTKITKLATELKSMENIQMPSDINVENLENVLNKREFSLSNEDDVKILKGRVDHCLN